jgi:hypothetical protein
MDLQRIKSNLMRFTLDGLAQSIVPRTAYDYTSVNADDMVSNEVGANVRCKGTPADKIMPIATVFPAGDAFSMLTYLDDVKSSRTGISKASQGLDPDVLQQTTATRHATMVAAEMRQSHRRFFAEISLGIPRHEAVNCHFDAPRTSASGTRSRKWTPEPERGHGPTVNVAIGSEPQGQDGDLHAGGRQAGAICRPVGRITRRYQPAQDELCQDARAGG